MKKLLIPLICLGLSISGCGGNSGASTEGTAAAAAGSEAGGIPGIPGFSQTAPPAVGEEYAVITTDLGEIELRLFPEYAPKAVKNFKTHARNGYYDGLIFHRVIEGFVIQTGDPLGDGTGGESIWGEGFGIETDVALRHYNGALGMARSNDPNSIGSQFYVVQNNKLDEDLGTELASIKDIQDEPLQDGSGETVADRFPTQVIDQYLELGGAPLLDFGYTVFGQVISGMDVVEAIAKSETDELDKPVSDVVMRKVEIREYGG